MEEKRPFRILGVQQIAIGGKDLQKLRYLWIEIFGLKKKGEFRSERENVEEDILEVGPSSFPVEIDLMRPLDPEKKPKVHDPPLNHIGLWVDDIEACYSYLKEKGVRLAPGGIREGAGGKKVFFIHPKPNEEFPYSGEGVLIEIVEAPPHIKRAFEEK